RSGDIRHCYGDASRINALGWRSRVRLEDGIRELVEWTATQQAEDRIEAAHRELVARGLVKE
ncbi:nucleoside-diphosphate sugar epimerase, partial [Candidatus Poribacteria bacterium]|nr:nucleoside-diphosphate sugar epimerase [Candidatus Poribacteria bacterium]